jgi:hypothetical protein
LDPAIETSNAKLPIDARLVLIGRDRFCSSFAAHRLREIGFNNATDVAGGVEAGQADRLPTEPYLPPPKPDPSRPNEPPTSLPAQPLHVRDMESGLSADWSSAA